MDHLKAKDYRGQEKSDRRCQDCGAGRHWSTGGQEVEEVEDRSNQQEVGWDLSQERCHFKRACWCSAKERWEEVEAERADWRVKVE